MFNSNDDGGKLTTHGDLHPFIIEKHTFQWPFQEPKLEVPTIYKAYFFRPMYPQNIVLYGTNVPPSVGSGRSPIEHSHPVILHFHQPQKNAIEGPSTGATVALSPGATSII